MTDVKGCAILSENLKRRHRYVEQEPGPVYGHYGYDADFSDYGHSLKAIKSQKRMAVRCKVLFGYAGIGNRGLDRRTAWDVHGGVRNRRFSCV